MEKTELIKIAPAYYALAICDFLERNGQPAFESEIRRDFSVLDHEGDVEYEYLSNEAILESAIYWLATNNMIEAIIDYFGPPVLKLSETYYDRRREITQDHSSPFFKYDEVHAKRDWLLSALTKLNGTLDQLEVTKKDFAAHDTEWAPLPLDRTEPKLNEVIDSLEEVAEAVRGDNGYAATQPEERSFVLKALRSTVETLKEEASTSASYLKTFALEPLARLATRFKDGAIGVLAAAAKGALIEWLKQHGIQILDTIFK